MQKKYYANNESIAQYQIDNSIEITSEQYSAAMSAKLRGQVVEVVDNKLVIKELYVKVTAYLKSDCTQQKEFDDKTLVTDDYTLDVPKTRFDEWINEAWVTNLQNQYQAQVQQVTDKRAYLYLDVDRLANEGKRILEIEGDEAKAEEYRLQANALYLKIRDENPWPTPPEA
ncbi:phage tail protein [Vibrio aestuarianus]|uniref:phage tail protein n=1 Tax=Vibrio aestuarianus TaxID=28171 RepID=UPI0015942355|nr:phage tail protein [Vibrio aestuarianus]MDE1235768.1 phage tail protein [Vibrio aestuarianus]MDE1246676.1 phage tail protein [Vibrio aestuarianus]MDE1316355.1 phage tail protein [Vibrio aestuarianus]NGZ63761.1 phage tail protein [Vibrio aestuarianus subsp. cardii]